MTDPQTAPDGDRLPATNSGQESDRISRWENWRLMIQEVFTGTTDMGPSSIPAPQQPPAQEQEDDRICPGGGVHQPRCPDYAPPSEADSAGEVEREARKWLDAEVEEPSHFHIGEAVRWALRRIAELETALAASPGVQGGCACKLIMPESRYYVGGHHANGCFLFAGQLHG